MRTIFERMTPPLRTDDVAKLAVGPKKLRSTRFSSWEAILSEIITGNAFGADRMDYLLRDSHHAGVAYGRFDHYRLIDTLRLLPTPPHGEEGYPEPGLGVDEGGLQSTEALLLARYFMYSQLYFHHVRRIYDIHLKDFLRNWLPGGMFSTNAEDLLDITDNEVTAAMLKASSDPQAPGHDAARRIVRRDHFRVLYQRHPTDTGINPEAGKAIFKAAQDEFGSESVRHDLYVEKGAPTDFPVLMRDGTVVSSMTASPALAKLPLLSIDYVFIAKEGLAKAREWLNTNKHAIILPAEEA